MTSFAHSEQTKVITHPLDTGSSSTRLSGEDRAAAPMVAGARHSSVNPLAEALRPDPRCRTAAVEANGRSVGATARPAAPAPNQALGIRTSMARSCVLQCHRLENRGEGVSEGAGIRQAGCMAPPRLSVQGQGLPVASRQQDFVQAWNAVEGMLSTSP